MAGEGQEAVGRGSNRNNMLDRSQSRATVNVCDLEKGFFLVKYFLVFSRRLCSLTKTSESNSTSLLRDDQI